MREIVHKSTKIGHEAQKVAKFVVNRRRRIIAQSTPLQRVGLKAMFADDMSEIRKFFVGRETFLVLKLQVCLTQSARLYDNIVQVHYGHGPLEVPQHFVHESLEYGGSIR